MNDLIIYVFFMGKVELIGYAKGFSNHETCMSYMNANEVEIVEFIESHHFKKPKVFFKCFETTST